MANITIQNLVNHNLCTEVNLTNFVRDLSAEQISLYGGMCVASYDGESQGCSDVIIDFPRKFDLVKIIQKR